MSPPRIREVQVDVLTSLENLRRQQQQLRLRSPQLSSEPASFARSAEPPTTSYPIKPPSYEQRKVSTQGGNSKALKRQTNPETMKKSQDLGKGRLDIKVLEDSLVESVVNAMKVKLSSVVGNHQKLRSKMKPLVEALRESESELKQKSIKNKSLLKLNHVQKEDLKVKTKINNKLQVALKRVKDQNEVNIKSFEAEKMSLKEELDRVREEKKEMSKESDDLKEELVRITEETKEVSKGKEVLKAALEEASDEKKAAQEASGKLERKVEDLENKLREQEQNAKERLKAVEVKARQEVEELKEKELNQNIEIKELRKQIQVHGEEKRQLTNQLEEETRKNSTHEISQLKAPSSSNKRKNPTPNEEHSYAKEPRLEAEEPPRSSLPVEESGENDSGIQRRPRLTLRDLSTVLERKRQEVKEDSVDEDEEEEKVMRKREEDDVTSLKIEVADSVKESLMKFYSQGVLSHTDFCDLAKELSHKFRGQVMERHLLCNTNLVGVSISQQDREAIHDYVQFHFVIDNIVRNCLVYLGISGDHHEYGDLQRRFCGEFNQKVAESIGLFKRSIKMDVITCYEKIIYDCIRHSLGEKNIGVSEN